MITIITRLLHLVAKYDHQAQNDNNAEYNCNSQYDHQAQNDYNAEYNCTSKYDHHANYDYPVKYDIDQFGKYEKKYLLIVTQMSFQLKLKYPTYGLCEYSFHNCNGV